MLAITSAAFEKHMTRSTSLLTSLYSTRITSIVTALMFVTTIRIFPTPLIEVWPRIGVLLNVTTLTSCTVTAPSELPIKCKLGKKYSSLGLSKKRRDGVLHQPDQDHSIKKPTNSRQIQTII